MASTPEERCIALDVAEEHGYAVAAERTGVPINTLRTWAAREGRVITVKGASTPRGRETAAAVETRLLSIAERKASIADQMIEDIRRLQVDLFAPTVERKAMAAGQMREVQVVTIEHETTTAAERKTTLDAIAKGVEVVQLLTGEATQRIEELVSPREAALAKVVELRARRAS